MERRRGARVLHLAVLMVSFTIVTAAKEELNMKPDHALATPWYWVGTVAFVVTVSVTATGLLCCKRKEPDSSISSSSQTDLAAPRVHTVRLDGSSRSELTRDHSCTGSAGWRSAGSAASAGWRSAGSAGSAVSAGSLGLRSATQFTLEELSLKPDIVLPGSEESYLHGARADPFDLRGENDNPDTDGESSTASSSAGFYTMHEARHEKYQRRRMMPAPLPPFGAGPQRVLVKKRKNKNKGRKGRGGKGPRNEHAVRFGPAPLGFDMEEIEEEEETQPTIVMAEGDTLESHDKIRPDFKPTFGKKEKKRYRTVTRRDWKKLLKWDGKLPASAAQTAQGLDSAVDGAPASTNLSATTLQSATDGGRTRRGWSSIFFGRSKSKTLTASATEVSAGETAGQKGKKKRRGTATGTGTATATATATDSNGSSCTTAESTVEESAVQRKGAATGSATDAPNRRKKQTGPAVRASAKLETGTKPKKKKAKSSGKATDGPKRRGRTASVITAVDDEAQQGPSLLGSGETLASDPALSDLARSDVVGSAGGKTGDPSNLSRASAVDKASNS